MILGYARVSTTKQDLESQVKRLESAGATRMFTDVMSGKRFDRPGLAEMMAFAREGDTLCVVRLDRLGRSIRELLEIVDHFKARKVDFRSLEEQLDTTTAAGSLIFHVFAALTDFERRLIAERTRDGLAVAMAMATCLEGPELRMPRSSRPFALLARDIPKQPQPEQRASAVQLCFVVSKRPRLPLLIGVLIQAGFIPSCRCEKM